jgi:phosphatidylglycerophosphate synthase
MNVMAGHVREHRSLLVDGEKRVLIWLAERMPAWVGSDHLTALGLGAMAMAGGAFVAARWDSRWLVLVVVSLALNWFGDSLDGTVARVRSCQRPRYGFYVDHAVDIVGATFLFAGLALSGYMSPTVALGVLVAFLLLSAETYLATAVLGVFRLSFMGIGPTELRILLAAGTLALFGRPSITLGSLGTFLLFDIGGIVAMVAMAGTLMASIARNTRNLYRIEPLPVAGTGEGRP